MTNSDMLLFPPEISEAIKKVLLDVASSSYWSDGPYNSKLQDLFNQHYGRYSTTFSSGGQAMACIAEYYSNVKRVAFQANTYFASIHPWLRQNHKFCLIRTEQLSLMPSLSQIEAVVNDFRPEVLVLTHIGGYPNPEIQEIAYLCNQHNIILIEDCAHSPFTQINDQYVGTYGNASIFSFYPTKPIPAGEGGILVTSDLQLFQQSLATKNYGKSVTPSGDVDHNYPSLGNCRMSEFNAAVAFTLSENYNSLLSLRSQIASIYDEYLPACVIKYRAPSGSVPSYYKYIVFHHTDGPRTSPVYDHSNQLTSILARNNINFYDPFPALTLPVHSALPIYPMLQHEIAKDIALSFTISK